MGELKFGGEEFIVIAGPCAVESESQMLDAARAVASMGVHMLRGGAFKPRTSPYTFQGLEEDGLKILAAARDATGLAIVTEAMGVSQVEIVARYADVIQIGSRSMHNGALLQEAGRSGKPVFLKRGMMATIDEFSEAAEILSSNGCPGVILCERGIRTFGDATRNTCDISAVPIMQQRTGWPVVVDPSHATGRRDLIAPMCKAAVGAGADGLMIEVHPAPRDALSDGPQSLTIDGLGETLRALQPHLAVWARERAAEEVTAVGL